MERSLTARDRAVLHLLADRPRGVNELFRILHEEGLASDKRQVSRSLEKLEGLGLVERRKVGQRVEAHLTTAGQALITMEEVREFMARLRGLVKASEVPADLLALIIREVLGIEIDPESLSRLLEQLKSAKRIECRNLVDMYIVGLAYASFTLGLLRLRQGPLRVLEESIVDSIEEIVKTMDEYGCVEAVEERLEDLKEAMVNAAAEVLRTIAQNAQTLKGNH